MTVKVAVFASGSGSNFQAIAQAVVEKRLDIEIACVIYDKKDAFVKERAKQFDIPAYYFNLSHFSSKIDYEVAILNQLQVLDVQLIILAGYMKIVDATLLTAYPNKILNIHPSLLPLFPGKQAILDAFSAQAQKTGVTVHLVDAGVDTGEVLEQVEVVIADDDTLESLTNKMHQAEHKLYPKVIGDFINKGV